MNLVNDSFQKKNKINTTDIQSITIKWYLHSQWGLGLALSYESCSLMHVSYLPYVEFILWPNIHKAYVCWL